MIIGVCIPTYNQANYLRLAVESALKQRGCEVEVWVSDDCSPDDTAVVMASYAEDSRVHYYRQPVNLGIAANAGWVIAQPKTEYVVRLDSDDLLEPDFCAELYTALDRHPRAGVAHAAVQEIDERGQNRRLRLLRRAGGYQEGEDAMREGRHGYRVAANICMFRRVALPTTVYRPGMNFAEDWDLFLRIAESGYGNVYVPSVLARYRVWSDAKGHRAARKCVELRGIQRLFDETLAPAWDKRGWLTTELAQSRSQLACGHSRVLTMRKWSGKEMDEILRALAALSPADPRLTYYIRIYRSWLGPIFCRFDSVRGSLKDLVKRCLHGIR